MYSNLEKLVLAVVAVAMITLILFTNSTKDVELSSTSPLETESVISQEVAVVSDEVVEDVTSEDSTLNEETWLESEMYVKTTDMDSLKEVNNYPSFKEAFADARSELGPGEVFEWEGRLYTTNYFYETKVIIGNQVVLDEKNASIVDTETMTDISEITSYTNDEDTDMSFDFYTGKTTGTSNDIASTTLQNQRVVDEEKTLSLSDGYNSLGYVYSYKKGTEKCLFYAI